MLQGNVQECAPLPRRYRLMMRCWNCMKESARVIDFGDDEEAPADIGELVESAAFGRIRYRCTNCDSAIGTVISVKQSKGGRS